MEDINLDQTNEAIATQLVAEGYFHSSVIHNGALGALMSRPGGPERYGQIFEIMAELAVDPATRADYLISAVYGIRNGAGKWDNLTIMRRLSEVYDILLQIPEKNVRGDLQRRHLYHSGLVFREVWSLGHFCEAARRHEEAAAIAPTETKRAIELVVATIEMCHHFLEWGMMSLEGHAMDQLSKQLNLLQEREEALRAFAPGDAEAEKWLRADIPAHRFYIQWLAGLRSYPERDADLTSITSLPEPLASEYAAWPSILHGLCALEDRQVEKALDLAEKLVAAGGHPTNTIFGLYIAAEALKGMGFLALAKQLAQHTVDYPTHGGWFVRAAAKRAFLL